jgi:O-antigen ligase
LRRTYWGELGIGTAILLLLARQKRVHKLIALVAILVVAAVILGQSFSGRLISLDLTNDGEMSADNADHLHDLMDAWTQVQQSPLMGIGVGVAYPTWHIRNWKIDSVMVHNAPLHVWLKYGLAGVFFYGWFHLALFRWLFRSWKSSVQPQRALLSAAFAFLTAQFAVTLGFAPWPYSELQLTILMSFIVAAAVAASHHPLPRQLLFRQLPIS